MGKKILRKKIIDCLFLDRRCTGAIQDLEKLIKQEKEEERKKIIKEIEKKLKNAEERLMFPISIATFKQILFELKKEFLLKESEG